jgi:hypothetical protein
MSRSFALFARGFSQEDHTTRLAKNLLASHESPVAPYQPPVPPADDVPRPPKRPQSANAAKRKAQSGSNARPKTPAKGAAVGNAKDHPNLHQQLYKEHKEKMKQTAP